MQEHANELARDGGFASRKLWVTLASMLIITGLGLLSGLPTFSLLGPNLGVTIGGVLGALGLFCGANVAAKFNAASVAKEAGKTAAARKAAPAPKAEPKPPVEQG